MIAKVVKIQSFCKIINVLINVMIKHLKIFAIIFVKIVIEIVKHVKILPLNALLENRYLFQNHHILDYPLKYCKMYF